MYEEDDWGLTQGSLSLEDSFSELNTPENTVNELDNVVLGKGINFPLKFIYQVLFIGGKRGSGKSYTAGVIMEECDRLGLQFVCFDTLDAHGHVAELSSVESITPNKRETVNMNKLLHRLKNTGSSLIINLSELSLSSQQAVIADYCDAILSSDLGGGGLMTLFEECQDFVPQMGRPESFHPIVRLCKLGRAKGYGSALISQRPAAVSKEALSQASIYMVHNVINTKDLNALKEQLSFGTDSAKIEKILDGLGSSSPGELICYAPEFFREEGYIVVGKIDRPRRTDHKGKNIEVRTKAITSFTPHPLERSQLIDPLESEDFNEKSFESDNEVSDDLSPSFNDDVPLSSQDEDYRYDFDDNLETEDGEEFENEEDTLSWIPQEINNAEVSSKPKNKSIQAIAAIAFLTGGLYLLSRRVSQGIELT
jgi:hypothetical protein